MTQADQVFCFVNKYIDKSKWLLYSTGKVYGIKNGLRFYYSDGSYIDLEGNNISVGKKVK